MTDIWPAVVAAAAGLAGAGLGTWGSVRTQSTTIHAETARWKADADERRRDRMLDRRIDVYSEYLTSTLLLFQISEACLRRFGVPPSLEELLTQLHRGPQVTPVNPAVEQLDEQMTAVTSLVDKILIISTTEGVRVRAADLHDVAFIVYQVARQPEKRAILDLSPEIERWVAAKGQFLTACNTEINGLSGPQR